MNPAAVRTSLQLPPDPVVYWAEVRTVCRPGSWSDEVWCFTSSIGKSVVLSAKVTSGPVTVLTNVTETGMLCRRHLKINNSTVNEYFLTKFCDVFKYSESCARNFVRMRWDFKI